MGRPERETATSYVGEYTSTTQEVLHSSRVCTAVNFSHLKSIVLYEDVTMLMSITNHDFFVIPKFQIIIVTDLSKFVDSARFLDPNISHPICHYETQQR